MALGWLLQFSVFVQDGDQTRSKRWISLCWKMESKQWRTPTSHENWRSYKSRRSLHSSLDIYDVFLRYHRVSNPQAKQTASGYQEAVQNHTAESKSCAHDRCDCAIFAVCWFPVHVNHLLRSFDLSIYCGLPAFLPLSFFLLAHANCAINPWVWFMFSGYFRNMLKRVVSFSDANIRSDNVPLTPKQLL